MKVPSARLCLKKNFGVLDKWSLIGKWSLTRGGRKWMLYVVKRKFTVKI